MKTIIARTLIAKRDLRKVALTIIFFLQIEVPPTTGNANSANNDGNNLTARNLAQELAARQN